MSAWANLSASQRWRSRANPGAKASASVVSTMPMASQSILADRLCLAVEVAIKPFPGAGKGLSYTNHRQSQTGIAFDIGDVQLRRSQG